MIRWVMKEELGFLGYRLSKLDGLWVYLVKIFLFIYF